MICGEPCYIGGRRLFFTPLDKNDKLIVGYIGEVFLITKPCAQEEFICAGCYEIGQVDRQDTGQGKGD